MYRAIGTASALRSAGVRIPLRARHAPFDRDPICRLMSMKSFVPLRHSHLPESRPNRILRNAEIPPNS